MIRNKEQTGTEKIRRDEPRRRLIPSRDGAVRKSPKSSNAVVRYFQDTMDELRKVSWPTRDQTVRLTLIVIGAVVVTGAFLGVLDFLFHYLAGLIV